MEPMFTIQAAERVAITRPNHMVGTAIARHLLRLGHPKSLLLTPNRAEQETPEQMAAFLEREQPEQVYVLAQTLHQVSGDLTANANERLRALNHDLRTIEAAFRAGARKLLYVCDARCYPVSAAAPLAEEDMGRGLHDPRRSLIGLAQYAALHLCRTLSRQYGGQLGLDYRGAVLCEVYGPGDQYVPPSGGGVPSQTVAALIAQIHRATNQRNLALSLHHRRHVDLLFVDDAADALVHVMELPAPALQCVANRTFPHLNIGSSRAIDLAQLTRRVADAMGHHGPLQLRVSSFAPPPLPLLDSQRLKFLGWQPLMELDYGLELASMDFRLHHAQRMHLNDISV
jgi:GDP-L-fucose synthase